MSVHPSIRSVVNFNKKQETKCRKNATIYSLSVAWTTWGSGLNTIKRTGTSLGIHLGLARLEIRHFCARQSSWSVDVDFPFSIFLEDAGA